MRGLPRSNNSRRNDDAGRDPAPVKAAPAGPPTARFGPEGSGDARRVVGLLLMHLGFGGMLLSVLWDVFYKGRTFELDAVGPFKLMGVAAGLALAAAGFAMAFYQSRKAVMVRQAVEGPPAAREMPSLSARERPLAAIRRGPLTAGAPDLASGGPAAMVQRQSQPEEDLPEALPVVEGTLVAHGSDVLEAVPLDPAPRPVAYRPSNRR